mgnify:CR=1 FL=1
MNKTDGYKTLIPVDDKLLEVTVKVLPQKNNKTSRWENICQWGQNLAKQKRISPDQVDKIITYRRYGKN